MKKIIIRLTTILAFVSMGTVAMAADWSEQQTAVWSVVSKSWADEVAQNGNWPANYVHDDVVGWGKSWPQPRGVESMAKWTRFGEDAGKTLIYELFPVSIVVAGNTAVVHYNSVTVGEDYENKRERSAGGLIETLVYNGKTWKFLSLTSFEVGSSD